MWKAIGAAATACVVLASTLAFAQQQDARTDRAQRWRPSAEDISAFTDARIAALKAGLKLTPEQEKNWPALEQSIRDLSKARAERINVRREQRRAARGQGNAQKNAQANPQADLLERLRRASDTMTQRAAGLRKLADAAQPLYQSLDESQKHRLAFLIRDMRPRRMAMGLSRGNGGHDRR